MGAQSEDGVAKLMVAFAVVVYAKSTGKERMDAGAVQSQPLPESIGS